LSEAATHNYYVSPEPSASDLPRSMPAVVCHEPFDYRLEEMPVPTPGPEEVLVRVLSVGICASDIKCYQGAPLFWGDEHREAYCQAPVIPGHEFVGEVVALGPGAAEKHGLRVGEIAVSEQIVPCWKCRYCQTGHYWMCQRHDIYGFRQATPGAMAGYLTFPAGSINHRIPPEVPAAHAVYVEPLACSIHAVERANPQLGDVVVVAGAGPLGLGMIAAARRRGPRLLVSLDLKEHRLEVARRCGADIALNPARIDVVDEVLRLTDGYGCDVYIEATGHPSAVEQGLRMVRKLGTFVSFSVMREPVTVDWTIIGDTKELNVLGAHLGPYCYPIAIDMLRRGELPMDAILTDRLPLTHYQEGIERMAGGEGGSIKVTLDPAG
jgi:erythritol/L-threitol dehydrogenase